MASISPLSLHISQRPFMVSHLCCEALVRVEDNKAPELLKCAISSMAQICVKTPQRGVL
ncbi:hypothetical protein MJ575_23610 [Klebsiella pneumoniae]|nr:hypothetical protein MJ575_23610 [Klebsiella pneumoniae]